jgi:hypothetical protein
VGSKILRSMNGDDISPSLYFDKEIVASPSAGKLSMSVKDPDVVMFLKAQLSLRRERNVPSFTATLRELTMSCVGVRELR